jgi:hypothetical protein
MPRTIARADVDLGAAARAHLDGDVPGRSNP